MYIYINATQQYLVMFAYTVKYGAGPVVTWYRPYIRERFCLLLSVLSLKVDLIRSLIRSCCSELWILLFLTIKGAHMLGPLFNIKYQTPYLLFLLSLADIVLHQLHFLFNSILQYKISYCLWWLVLSEH